MHGRYALCVFMGISLVDFCSAQTYSGFESPNDLSSFEGSPVLQIRRENGSVLAAPRLRDQVAYSDVKFSPDRRRVGWVVLMPSNSTIYPIPTMLVIFRGDKIERVIEDESCVSGWTFQNDGRDVAYEVETPHFSSGKVARLREIHSGKLLATYGLQRVEGEIPAEVLELAPRWVREIPNIGR